MVQPERLPSGELPEHGHSRTLPFWQTGIGILEGPRAKIVDFSLLKNLQIHERVKLQFRSQKYNLFSTPQFARPNGGLNAGRSSPPTRAADGTINCPSQAIQIRGVGTITSLVSPIRQILLGLNLL